MARRMLLDETRFPTRFVVDPVTGDDRAQLRQETVTVNGQQVDQVTATVATLQGALDRVPKVIKHPIFIELPLGNLSAGANGPVTFGPEAHLSGKLIDLSQAEDLDPPNLTFDATPGVYFQGQASEVIPGVVAAAVTASSCGGFAGLTDGAHRGQLIEVVSGTGAGQLRRIVQNNATSVQLLTSWSVQPDGTSTVRIVEAGSVIQGALVIGNMDSGSVSAVCIDPLVRLDTAGGPGQTLLVSDAAISFAGELVGPGEGSTLNTFDIRENGRVFFDYIDLRNDPNFTNLFFTGGYLRNGSMGVFRQSEVNGQFTGLVVDAGRVEASEQAIMSMVADLDGNRPTLGGRTPSAGVISNRESVVTISPAAGNGQGITGYGTVGVQATRRSEVSLVAGMDISDNADGLEVLDQSTAFIAGVVTTTNNDAYGAIIRGNSVAYINRTTTTLTGVTADVRLGNVTSGADRSWTDCNANDAFTNGGGETAIGAAVPAAGIAEWGTMIDRSGP